MRAPRKVSPAMRAANFCLECGERLARKGWRARLRGNLCDACAQRFGTFTSARSIIVIALIAGFAFATGRYMRPSPPPLVIQRAANSPLSDLPVNSNDTQRPSKPPSANASLNSTTDDAVYICGARTQKGTPCRRRVHAAGERCFQHKGMAAMVPLEKLRITP